MATYYWRGSTGGTASNYAWNVPENWVKLIQSTPTSPNRYFVGATNGIPSAGDDVYIGGFITGPTCVSPLIYGGYSGAGNTGSWISNIGGTGVTQSRGELNSLYIGWQTGATAKYPFSAIGGGKNIVWDMTGSNFSTGVVGTQTPGLTPDSLVGTYYDTLTVLANTTYETSSSNIESLINNFNPPTRTISLNYALGSTAFNRGLYTNTLYKGSRVLPGAYYQNNEWEGGVSSSTTKLILSGYVNRIIDQSRPSDRRWTSARQYDYGRPEIWFQGCTFTELQGNTYSKVNMDTKSTGAFINLKSWFNYPQWYVIHNIAGEMNASKAFSAFIGSGVTGGITGAGSGTLVFNANWSSGLPSQWRSQWLNNWINSVPEEERYEHGGILNFGDYDAGATAPTKIGALEVYGSQETYNQSKEWSGKPFVTFANSTLIGKATLDYSSLGGTPRANQTLSFGYIDGKNDSSLNLYGGGGGSWVFGVTAASGTTAVVGGIYSSDGTLNIQLGSGIPLFNKSLVRTFKDTTYIGAFGANTIPAIDPIFEPDGREAL